MTLVLVAVADGQSQRDGPARFVPGEIIVKFRGSPVTQSSASDANEALIMSRLLADKGIAGTGWHVRAVRPLLERVRQPGSASRVFPQGSSQIASESRLRRLVRQNLMPQDRAAPDLSRVYRVSLSGQDQANLGTVLQAYRNMPEVEYAELNPIVSACAAPNDPLFASQWAIAKIQAPAAWDTCVGTASPIVAVIDSGADLTHRDLQSNLWVNEAELNGTTGVDDDENGYVDDIHGYNFIYRTNDPSDDCGHGTHVAGIIAAAGNDGADITGVCWRARIMPLKILDSDGNGDAADGAEAVYYAVTMGADVINASWGGTDTSQVLADAIAYAQSQGVLVVAAAGNSGSAVRFYPAGYSAVIAVGATDKNDRRWSLSNYGSWVAIAAPGYDILSLRAAGTSLGTLQDAFTTSLTGTSMAAPHVTGACALLLAADPFLTPEQVRQILTTTGDPIAPGFVSSNERLDVAGAMKQAVASKGVVYFDRSAYSLGSDIGILLVDSDLAGQATQAVTIQTDGGDAESVVLSQTTWAKGVFAGTIAGSDANAVPGNGRLEIRDGQQMTVGYVDANDGLSQASASVAQAHADYQPASVVGVQTGIRSSAVRLVITTSEPASVEVRYHRQTDSAAILVAHSDALSSDHEILLSPLPRKTDYRFTIRLTDAAGNETTDANGGNEYTFSTAAETTDLRVPSVYATLQAAIDAAWNGDTIRVADGTYHGGGNHDIDFGGKALTLVSENGPGACIIDCNGSNGGFYFHRGEDAHSIVDGFTITNAGNVDDGGAILCVDSSPTIRNCVFVANKAGYYGAGVCNEYGSSPVISQCTFKNNSCSLSNPDARGGGIANRFGSDPTISDCTFVGNTAGESGGAIANADDSQPQIVRCLFQGNTASYQGGAVANLGRSLPVLAQCVFSNNSAKSSGGALYCEAGTETHLEHCLFNGNAASLLGGAITNDGATVALTNCTVASNKGQWYCGGLWNGSGSTADVEDSILWGNTDSYGQSQIEKAQIVRDNAEVTVNYSCAQGASASLSGVGNIGSDPLFADPQNGDFHLKSAAGRWDANRKLWVTDTVTSPCIDAGDPNLPLGDEPLSTPLDPANAWSINRRIDMGVYGGTPEASMAPLK